MNADLRQKISRIRQVLDDAPDSYMFAEFYEGTAESAPPLADLPDGLRDLLAITNGLRAGSVAVFAAEKLALNQFHCDTPAVEGGSDRYICFAMGADFPLMMEKSTGAVWWFPELDAEDYFLTNRFELLTDDLDRFLDFYVFGPGYREFSPSSSDWWYQFLREQDFISE